MSDLADRFFEARTANEISIKAAARQMGLAFSALTKMNRGERISAHVTATVEAWIAAQPPAPEVDPNEEWRPIPGWEAEYEASNFGNVRSVLRAVPHPNGSTLTIIQRPIRQAANPRSGHMTVSLCRDGRCVKRYVHQLVLSAFVGPKPDGMEGCHYDGDPANNRLENLRWGTHEENMQDAVRHQTMYQMANWKGCDEPVLIHADGAS